MRGESARSPRKITCRGKQTVGAAISFKAMGDRLCSRRQWIKSGAMTLILSPQCRAYIRDVKDEKSQSPGMGPGLQLTGA